MATIVIHHADTTSDNPPIVSAVVVARRHVISRRPAANASHSTGPGAIIARAVGLIDPVVTTTRAASAAWRQRVRVAASAVRPTSQPRPAHGSSIADVRDTYGRRYGVSW